MRRQRRLWTFENPNRFQPMSTTSKVLTILILLILGGGVIFLAAWDMPPPSQKVEKVIPNDKILR